MGVRRAFYAKYKPADEEVVNFLNFLCSQHFPVFKSYVPACARQAATNFKLSEFKGFSGWLRNILGLSGVQPSF